MTSPIKWAVASGNGNKEFYRKIQVQISNKNQPPQYQAEDQLLSSSRPPNFSLLSTFKVWWLDATFFVFFLYFYRLRHTFIAYKSQPLRPTPLSSLLPLRRGISTGVTSRESNQGLQYSKPTHYSLSLRRTLIWVTSHPTELRRKHVKQDY